MVAFAEIDQAHEDVIELDGHFFAAEGPEVCRILKGDGFRLVRDHVVLGAGRIGVIIGVDDFVETNPATRFDGGYDGSFDEVFALGIR